MKVNFLSILSLVMSFFYYLPWMGETSHAKLGPYIIAFFWFVFAWTIMFFYFYRAYKMKNINLSESLLFRNSALIIFVSYVIVLIGALNGVMVSV